MNAPLPRDGLRAFEAADGRGRAARGGEVPWPSQACISLCVVGLAPDELRRLHRLVQGSARRAPRLVLVDAALAHEADVVLVDGTDAQARAWSRARPWLDGRAVVWVGTPARLPGHLTLQRPIAWATLPIVLADAQRHAPALSRALATRAVQPQSPTVLLLSGGGAPEGERLRGWLEACGRRVVVASTAREGLAALHAARYDGVILAGQVPDLDRLALCARLRSLQGRVGRLPLLLLDGPQVSAWARLRARMAGYDEVAAMPGGLPELQAVLGRLPVVAPQPAAHAPDPAAG